MHVDGDLDAQFLLEFTVERTLDDLVILDQYWYIYL